MTQTARAFRFSALLTVVAALAFGCLLAAAHGDEPAPRDPAQLRRAFADALENKAYDRALVALRALDEIEADAGNAYNIACVYALSGNSKSALIWLESSAARGFADPEQLRNDADLDSIRDDESFAAVVERVAANRKRSEDAFAAKLADNEPIVVVPPRKRGRKGAPGLLVAMHGYGGRAEVFVDAYRDVAADGDFILVVPRAVEKARSGFSWGDVDRADRIVTRAIEIAAKKHDYDRQRVVLSGFSQGGYMAYLLGLRHPDVFRGVIPVAGRWLDNMAARAPAAVENGQRYFIMMGADDGVANTATMARDALAAAGVDVELAIYDGLGHAYPKARKRELLRALAFVLP